ncbi:ferredoxin [Streptomyces lavendulocolor]|uniref:ferredoxin n=1 Tax=Streptomyces lavendulocolor TaxID=67316 RepID=UPI0033C6BD2F
MELRVDRDRCAGSGMCALTAPEVFDQDDEDGRVLLLDARPPAGPAATAAREAAGLCPAGAITARPGPEGGQPMVAADPLGTRPSAAGGRGATGGSRGRAGQGRARRSR